jgi:hypothetical protein
MSEFSPHRSQRSRQISSAAESNRTNDPNQEEGQQENQMIMTTISEVFRSLGGPEGCTERSGADGPDMASRVVTMAPIQDGSQLAPARHRRSECRDRHRVGESVDKSPRKAINRCSPSRDSDQQISGEEISGYTVRARHQARPHVARPSPPARARSTADQDGPLRPGAGECARGDQDRC